MLLTALGWIAVLAIAALAFMFCGAGIGALIGKAIATVRKPRSN